jgi:hypothetical protein
MSGGGRRIVFDVAGTINLGSICDGTGSSVTIDGSTAPSPGITLTGWPIRWSGAYHDIIIKHVRHRGMQDGGTVFVSGAECITLINGVSNVVIDHCSLAGTRDETMGPWRSSHDITISNCIFGPGPAVGHNYALLVGQLSSRISIHHNLIYGSEYRNPAIGWDELTGQVAPSIVADVRCNLVWNYLEYGTHVYYGGAANVVKNYYRTVAQAGLARAVTLETNGRAYLSGNYSKDSSTFPSSNATEYAVDGYAVVTQESNATNAAAAILNVAGCRVGGLDAFDTAWIAAIRAVGL